MTTQWVIVGILGVAATVYIVRLLVKTFRAPQCTGCASQTRTSKLLKKLGKKQTG